MTPDILNGLFEFGGAYMYYISIRHLLRDKTVKGFFWQANLFFMSWGMWNLYYYPHLNQWFSFIGGSTLVLSQLIYNGLVIYFLYGRKK